MDTNVFLASGPTPTVKGGGGGFIEDPRAVENIVFQTRALPLDPFESDLADALMAAFGEGAETLEALAGSLNRHGSMDRDGRAWDEGSLADQLKQSGDALFAAVPTGTVHG